MAGRAVLIAVCALVAMTLSCGSEPKQTQGQAAPATTHEQAEPTPAPSVAPDAGLRSPGRSRQPSPPQTPAPAVARMQETVTPQARPEVQQAKSLPPATQDIPDDAVVVKARLIEIPGTFPPNDLYNYVYIMKYRVLSVIRGKPDGQEILVGHYNPLIPRAEISDKMAKYVSGNVTQFREGDTHQLVLVAPIEKVWSDALEDEYFDSEKTKYFALRVDGVR